MHWEEEDPLPDWSIVSNDSRRESKTMETYFNLNQMNGLTVVCVCACGNHTLSVCCGNVVFLVRNLVKPWFEQYRRSFTCSHWQRLTFTDWLVHNSNTKKIVSICDPPIWTDYFNWKLTNSVQLSERATVVEWKQIRLEGKQLARIGLLLLSWYIKETLGVASAAALFSQWWWGWWRGVV